MSARHIPDTAIPDACVNWFGIVPTNVISIYYKNIGSDGAVALAPALKLLTGLQHLKYVHVGCIVVA